MGLLLIGVANLGSGTISDRAGIHRRELLRYRLLRWDEVREIRCRPADTGIQRIVAVRAVVRSRSHPVLLGQFRDPRTAADWTEALMRWRSGDGVRPPAPRSG